METVRNWKLGLTAEQLAEVSRNTQGRLYDLVCDHLETTLKSLSEQSRIAADSEYVKRQSAKDVAMLHSVLFDRTFAMLERWKP